MDFLRRRPRWQMAKLRSAAERRPTTDSFARILRQLHLARVSDMDILAEEHETAHHTTVQDEVPQPNRGYRDHEKSSHIARGAGCCNDRWRMMS